MERFINWLTQRSTMLAIGDAIVTALITMSAYGMIDLKWAAIVSVILTAFGLKINDKGVGKGVGGGTGGLTGLVCILAFGAIVSGCGATLPDLPISDEDKIDIAVTAGCTAAASAGCLDDEDVVNLFGDFKTAPQCVGVVKTAIETRRLTVDLSKITARNMTCKKFVSAFLIL